MSDAAQLIEAGEDFIAHYGKKGMKWGVRNDRGHEGERVKTKKLDKLDKQWERDAMWKAHNAMADKMNNGMIDDFNNDKRWFNEDGSRIDFTSPANAKKLDEYETAFFALSDKVYMQELTNLGVNPSGTKHFKMSQDADGNDYVELVDTGVVKHAEGDKKKVLKITRNAMGYITKLTETEAELKHYGVKGMKWGVTKIDKATKPTVIKESETARTKPPVDITVSQRREGTYVKSKGGERHGATDEAVKAEAVRRKAKKSTTDALTNDELRLATERMRLEREFRNEIDKSERISIGRWAVQMMVKAAGNMNKSGGNQKKKD